MINISLKDGSKREFPKGSSLLQIAEGISPKLAKFAVTALFNGRVRDLNAAVFEDGVFEIMNFDDEKGRQVYRHSSSHVMAQAVKRLWPNTKFAIGPAVD